MEHSYAWEQSRVLINEYNRLYSKYGLPSKDKDAIQNLKYFITSNIDEAFHEDISNGFSLEEVRVLENSMYDLIDDPNF